MVVVIRPKKTEWNPTDSSWGADETVVFRRAAIMSGTGVGGTAMFVSSIHIQCRDSIEVSELGGARKPLTKT